TVSSSQAEERVRVLSPKLIWVELSPNPEHALSLLSVLKEKFPSINIFVSSPVPDPALIRASYRLGASDFLDAERWKTDLPAAIESIAPGREKATNKLWLLPLVIIAISILIGLTLWTLPR